MRRVLAASVLVVTSLAGCSDGSSEESGFGILPEAWKIAASWSSNPVLRDLQGVEATSESESLVFIPGNRTDSDLANGKTPTWRIVFMDGHATGPLPGPSLARLDLVLDARGNVLERKETGNAETPDHAQLWQRPRSWTVDSDDAIRLARAANATFDEIASAATAIGYFLHLSNESVYWEVDMDGSGRGMEAYVDVETGAVTELHEHRAFEPRVPREESTMTQPLAAAPASTEHSFTLVEKGHPELRFRLLMAPALPTASASALITDPAGHETTVTLSPTNVDQEASTSTSLEAPLSGTWSVTLRLESGVAHEIRLDWCAPGTRDLCA
ncbi:MAG: hypothetical protein AABY18_10255 [Candidatus Thermoplasmatota archaeon]